MANKAGPFNTPIRRGFGHAHKVAAAGGGRVTVGNQCAKKERQALWLDPDTGEWREFSEALPQYDPHYFRTSAANSIFEKGLWSRMRRQPVSTYKGLDWSGCQFEDVAVIVSVLASDKPLGSSTAVAPKPSLSPLSPTAAKEAALKGPKSWVDHMPTRFPEKPEEETREEYFDRTWRLMCKELKARAWARTTFERQCYLLGAVDLRQPRSPRQPSAKPPETPDKG